MVPFEIKYLIWVYYGMDKLLNNYDKDHFQQKRMHVGSS